MLRKWRFVIAPSACVWLAMMLLLLPLRWIFAAAIAAAFHEFSHVLAVYLCGGSVRQVFVGNRGAVLQANAMSSARTILCILAGPLGSLCLVLFVRWLPRIAFCGLFHGIYNLLPFYPLDGGRVLRCVMQLKNRP